MLCEKSIDDFHGDVFAANFFVLYMYFVGVRGDRRSVHGILARASAEILIHRRKRAALYGERDLHLRKQRIDGGSKRYAV